MSKQAPHTRLEARANCTGCGGCLAACPIGALSLGSEGPGGWGPKRVTINLRCTNCGACLPSCPRHSLCRR